MSHIDWRFDHARMTGFNIKNTQERLGTFPDGIIGSDTWNAIEKLLNERDELKRTCSKLRLQNKSLENDILKLQHKEYLKELEKETKGEDQEGCFFCKDGEPVECHNKNSLHALSVEEARYRYSISVRDMDGVHEFAFDNTKSPDLISLSRKPELGNWVEAQHLDQLLSIAASELREAIGERIEQLEQLEAKENESDAN